jgi:tetratricopeptide (TPR) repeat protein
MSLVVVTVAVLCYANALGGEFVYDDTLLIVNNDIIKDPRRIAQLFSTNLWGLIGQQSNYYRPLPALLFMVLHAVVGLEPAPFRAVNVVLHGGTTALVFLTAATLLVTQGVSLTRARWSAFAAAAMFAAHPIHTEAVAWISGVMDVSCTFLSVLAIYWYVSADDRSARLPRAMLSLGALVGAMLCKEPAMVVPVVLVGYDLLFRRDRVRTLANALRRWGPPFAVLMSYIGVRAHVLGGLAPFRQEHQGTLLESLLTMPGLFARYVQMLVAPVGLNVLHHLAPVTSPTSREFVWALAVIAAFGVVTWYARKVGRAATFGVLLFSLPLAPSLYVPALGQDPSLVFAERYLYFPSVGAAVLLSAFVATLGRKSPRIRAMVAVGVAAGVAQFALMTVSRNAVWKDDVALWSDAVGKSPDSGAARENLGLALIARGRVEEGGRELRAALRLDPNVARRYLNYGVFAAQQGLVLQAIQSFQTALLYRPDWAEAHYNLAVAFERMGWNRDAITEYRATIANQPAHADAHHNLAIILAQSYRMDEALDHFKAAVQARPNDPELRQNLARAYDAKGLTKEAAEQRALAGTARAAQDE